MDALVLIDLQYDFMPGGALAVPLGDEIVPVANSLISRFELVVASRDWHPQNHVSFATNHPGCEAGQTIDYGGVRQILWPVHCVQNTHGAKLHGDLDHDRITRVFDKGVNTEVDSYSCFFDNARRGSTGMDGFLRERGVRRLYLLGLATDYCVRFSALDAASLGFETVLIEDGCRGIELNVGDIAKAIESMRAAGVRICNSNAVLR